MNGGDAFDVIVIGAGSGGLTAAAGLSRLGKRVALVERGAIGGDCTNLGCIPSKTLIHAAKHHGGASAREVLAHVRARRDAFRDHETAWVQNLEGLTLVRGQARFVAPHQVEVSSDDGHLRGLTAAHIVIATGSRPCRLEIEALPVHRVLTNESMFDLEDAPRHLAIIGGGAIGCEMAFAFRRLGSRVSLVQRSERVLIDLEPEAGALIERRMEQAGIELHVDAQPRRWSEPMRILTIHGGGRSLDVPDVDRVLMAVGREPNCDLRLASAGVRADGSGIPTDRSSRTNVRHIFAVGDVTPGGGTTQAANAQGRQVVRAIAFPWLPTGPTQIVPSVVFTDPEVAHAGPPATELQARFAPGLIRTLRLDLATTDRGYTMGLAEGLLQVHAMRLTGRVLSATIAAPGAGEMIPLLTLAIQRRIPLWSLSRLVLPYPILSEALKQITDDFMFEAIGSLRTEAALYLRHRWRGRRIGNAERMVQAETR